MKKKIKYGILGVLAIGIIYLVIAGNETQEIRTEIDIDASPDQVWKVVADIEKWHEWSPIINLAKGTAEKGAQLQIVMAGKQENSDGPIYTPTITKLETAKLLHWRAYMMAGFIFTNDKVIELEETATGTKLVHKELFKGILAPIFCSQMEKGVPPMLNKMNVALKEVVEKSI